MWKDIKSTCKSIFSILVRRKMSMNIYKGTVNEGFSFRDDELGLFRLRLERSAPPLSTKELFCSIFQHFGIGDIGKNYVIIKT